jgi:hypothetical protein
MPGHASEICLLDVQPLPCIVDAHREAQGEQSVFDAWSWCGSDVLEWRRPAGRAFGLDAQIEGHNPPGLAFVMRQQHAFLPQELARLHAFGYGLSDEMALAPWAIDDATDLLYEHRLRPRDVFWLAAGTLDALVWGLHDWAHFHNHGPFDQPAMTELQCDLLALAWIRANADRIGIDEARLNAVARDLAALSRKRFAEERVRSPAEDLDALFLGPYPRSLA